MPVYRKLLPAEISRYRDHLLRLSRTDRHARFSGTVSDDGIENHCRNLDWSRTILIGAFHQGVLRGAVELCTDRLIWPDSAELAISVEKDFQEMRVGSALVRRALTIARNRSIRTIVIICQATNRRMRSLARRYGGTAEIDGGEVVASLTLEPADQFSLALEALEDGTNAVGAVLDGLQAGWMERRAA